MAMTVTERALLVLASVCFCALNISASPDLKVPPRKEDIPLIKCDVCRLMARNAFEKAHFFATSSTEKGVCLRGCVQPKDEADWIETIEKMTTAWRKEGEWITSLHLVSSRSKLEVVLMGGPGQCGEACRTIEKAAQEIMGNHDADVAEALYMQRHRSKQEFVEWMCETLTAACTSPKSTLLPKGHAPYPAFKVLADEQNPERILGEMEDAGLKGRIWSKEDLLERYMAEAGLGMDDDMLNANIQGQATRSSAKATKGGLMQSDASQDRSEL